MCVCACVCVCVCVCLTQPYIRIYIHTYMYIHIQAITRVRACLRCACVLASVLACVARRQPLHFGAFPRKLAGQANSALHTAHTRRCIVPRGGADRRLAPALSHTYTQTHTHTHTHTQTHTHKHAHARTHRHRHRHRHRHTETDTRVYSGFRVQGLGFWG